MTPLLQLPFDSSRRESDMLSLVVMLLIVPHEASATATATADPFFPHVDEETGEALGCALCPPGFHVRAHCTRTNATVCAACPNGTFTQFWNYLPRCLYCSNFCVENEVVKEECSATHNRVCECAKGHYQRDGLCVAHTRCAAGFGAVKIGTAHRDTVCQQCPHGTFSAESSSNGQCVQHTDCGELLVLLKGKNWHNNICTSCDDLKHKGDMAFLKVIIPGLFTHEKLTLRRLKRFVSLIGERRQLPNKHGFILLITKWTEKADADQLKKLPEILQRSGLKKAANKLKRKFKELEGVSKCDTNNAKL